MKSISVSIKNKTTIELTEDAQKGDIIDLSQITTVDTSFLNELIEEKKEQVLNRRIKEEVDRKIIELNKDNQIKLNAEISRINKTNEEAISKIKEENKQKELSFARNLNEKDIEINNLKNEISNLNKQKDSDIKNKELEILNKYKDELSNLKLELQTRVSEIKELKNQYQLDLEKEKSNLKDQFAKQKQEEDKVHEKEKEDLINQINQLQRNKAVLNIKNTGEDLEVWCDKEVESYMQNGFSNCTWHKDNKVVKDEDEIKGSKADFIFKIYADDSHSEEQLLTSVCLDMKDENPDSTYRKANKDYYAQLDRNRIKKQCKYAVLVSNLERKNNSNDIPIFKVKEYQDMYVVRPEYLMTFLNMLVSLTNKFAYLYLQKAKEEIQFFSREQLFKKFDELKNTYLDKPLETLGKRVDEISKQNENIASASKKIDEAIEAIKKHYLDEIEKKLNNFDIKITKEYKTIG